jgi:hypothetical protein
MSKYNKSYVDSIIDGTRKSTWDLMKEVATPEELKELNSIEQSYKNNSNSLNSLGKRIVRTSNAYQINKLEGPIDKKVKSGQSLTPMEQGYRSTYGFKETSSSLPLVKDNPIQVTKHQEPKDDIDIHKIIKERAAARLKKEQEDFDKMFGIKGIPTLKRPI